jgi:hypothetical protein
VVLFAETGARGAELFDNSKDEKRDGVTWGDVDWHNPVWRHDDGSVAQW